MYKFIDLFCGIGGFRVALQKQGMECVFSSDIDKHVQNAYFENFGERPVGDITEIHAKQVPKHDILCAGFPCQPFSVSGKQSGLNDDRGRLFYEIIRIAEFHRPPVMLLENVKNIISIDNGNVIKTIENKLDEIGYKVHRHLLNASEFGVPQSRERVYFVCLRKDANLKYKPPKPNFKEIYLENILEKKPDEGLYIEDRYKVSLVDGYEDKDYQLKPIRVGSVSNGEQGNRIYSIKGHAITMSAFTGGAGRKTGLYLDGERVRRLSILEAKRIMGFPNNHYVSDGMQGYQQLGNAVIPPMIESVYKSIKVI